MNKRIEDFSAHELLERRHIQELLHNVLTALKHSLDEQRYDDAVFLNVQGARVLNLMVKRELALTDEVEMANTLRSNVSNILKLQYRLQ